jgi:hypothetical protein
MQKFIRTSALMFVFGLAACKSDVDEAVGKMKKFADDMCACKDKACAEKVSAEMAKYGEEMSKKHEGKEEPKISDAQKKEMEDSTKKLMECTTKAMGS